ncbi:glycosyltransferase [Crossiella sp. CA198]|uniref:glycosyltransferase n=1 Tax=Crossiella sp. CA198 TaxID=3455607 RepID=UPI003F8CF6E4
MITAAPLLGHLLPMVPLARALREAGHEVLLATAGEAMAVADQADLPVRDLAPGFKFEPIVRRTLLWHPLIAKAEIAGKSGTRGAALLFGHVNEEIADGAVALARSWKPDLILHEPLAIAGALAAAVAGVPAVLVENSLFDGLELLAATRERLAKPLRRNNIDELPGPAARIVTAPPSLVGEQPGWPMRYEPYSGAGEIPAWLSAEADRPRIAVSRSTVGGPGGNRLMSAVADAADGLDAEIVLLRPDRRILRRESLPGNVRTLDWAPLTSVLAHCAALVHHGGAGSVAAALAAGIPQLVVPGAGDRDHNARLVAKRGAGTAVAAKDISTAELRRLLTEPGLTEAALAVRKEMAAMPAPATLVPKLVALGR